MKPSFSIVIETENLGRTNWGALRDCLDGLGRQEGLDKAREVLLVYNPVGAHIPGKREYPWLTLCPTPGPLPYYGSKNYGAERTTGDVIVFLDSDCTPEPGWLTALLAPFSRETVALGPEADKYICVVGGETTVLPKGIHGLAMSMAYIFPQFSYGDRVEVVDQFWANNFAIKRRTWEEYPLMDNETITRCPEHALMLTERFRTIIRQPAARVAHVPTPWGRFYHRWTEHGRDGARWSKVLHPRRPMWKLAGRSVLWKSRVVYRQGREVLRRDRSALLRLPLALPIVGAAIGLYAVGALSAAYDDRKPQQQVRADEPEQAVDAEAHEHRQRERVTP